MEGRVLLKCGECDRTRQIAGEIPDEYIQRFAEAVHSEGWAPRPGANTATLICRDCLVQYSGHETVDDEEKIRELT